MNIDLLNLLNETAPVKYAYIDPGTGSMLFTILIGAVSVVIYGLRGFFIKLRYSFNKDAKKNENTLPFVIFSDDKRYWNTFGPICEELEKRKQKTVYLTQSEDDPAFNANYEYIQPEFIGEGNKGFAKLNMLDADVLLSTTPSLDVYQWKRSKNVKYYVHILHAANDATSYRMFGIDYYDAVIVSGQYQKEQIRKLEELRHLPEKEVEVLGIPYLDVMKKRYESEKYDHTEKTVLLAPTWGPYGLLNKYGEKILDALLKTGYHVIVRPHPQSFSSEKEMLEGLMKKYPDSDQLEWNRDRDNFSCLNRSDIMISDFSGVIFDFSLVFDRPILYADVSFDKSVYDAWWLDEEMWTFRSLPRLGRQLKEEDLSDLKKVIDDTMNSEELQRSREEVRKECWEHMGESASLVADYLVNKVKEVSEVKE